MITKSCIETMLPIVADSWEKLRGCDVFRLLDTIAYESQSSLAIAGGSIVAHRPDLASAVFDAVEDLRADLP